MEFLPTPFGAVTQETGISAPFTGIHRKGRKPGSYVRGARIADYFVSELCGRGNQPEDTHKREEEERWPEDFTFFKQAVPQNGDKILAESRHLLFRHNGHSTYTQTLRVRDLLP